MALCSWKIHMYRTSCLGAGSTVRWLAGRPGRAGAHLSPFLSKFLKAALWQGRCLCDEAVLLEAEVFLHALAFPPLSRGANCSGGFARPPSPGWLPSCLCSHCHFSLQAQIRGDKLFPMHLIDKSCRTMRKAPSWLLELLWQTTAQ